MAQATELNRPGKGTDIKYLEVKMHCHSRNIALGAIVLLLFGLLPGQVVSAEEAKVVFGVA